MAFITWSDEYSVNIREIDQQHQQLIELINRMHDIVIAGGETDKKRIRRVLLGLANYTNYHFYTEEELFRNHHYPVANVHKQQHNQLTIRLLTLQKQFSAGDALISQDIFDFLKDWLVNHILGSDKEYTVFLNAKGVF